MNTENNKKWILLVLISSIAGIFISAYTAWDYYILMSNSTAGPSYCAINTVINCDAVTLSGYANLFGLPYGVYGGIYFLFTAILAAAMLKNKEKYLTSTSDILFPVAVAGVIFCLILLTVQLTAIKSFCINCSLVYLMDILVLIGAWKLTKSKKTEVIKRVPSALKNIPKWAWAAFVAGAAVYGMIIYVWATKMPHSPTVKGHKITVAARPWRGPQKPELIIVEFSDFMCPACRAAAHRVKAVLDEFTDKVTLVFKNFPLDQACNPSINRPFHDGSCLAATAALCAKQQGKFWEYHDMLFSGIFRPDEDFFISLAARIGINKKEFKTCLNGKTMAGIVKQDIKEGIELGINATPTFIIGDEIIAGAPSPTSLRNKILKKLMNNPSN